MARPKSFGGIAALIEPPGMSRASCSIERPFSAACTGRRRFTLLSTFLMVALAMDILRSLT